MIDKFLNCDIILKKLVKKKGKIMKANIHPEMKEVTVKCACGETFTTLSTDKPFFSLRSAFAIINLISFS